MPAKQKKSSKAGSGGACPSEIGDGASVITPLDTGRIEQIPFLQLAVSPLNVRKDAEVGAGDELVASIRAHGLLQPLIGYIAKSGPAIVLIAAGQRRYLALQHIAAPETLIPVRIVDEQTAIEVSLAENLERKNMNPADELAAFQALVDTGSYDANRIADRFGFDRRYVRRRLKMAVLAPEILEALRAGTIGISSAEAYAANDDQDLQLKIFKEQSRPNAWNAHSPGAILQGFACAGIGADSGVGKFIGGVAAYEAAGGSCAHDDAFSEMFGDHAAFRGARLTDPVIVRTLFERAQAAAQDKVEALARARFPFAGGVQWCDAQGNAPKPAKSSELVLLQVGWDAASGEHRGPDDIAHLGEKAAAAGGLVEALAFVDPHGEENVRTDALLVSKDALAKVAPKAKDRAQSSAKMSDEEVAARERDRLVAEQMRLKYGRSLVGETPGFGVTQVSFSRYDKRLVIQLKRLEPDGDDIDFSDQWDPEIRAELLEPFRSAAEAKVDAIAAEAERAKAEADKARQKAVEHFDATLSRLRSTPLGEWPSKVELTIDGYQLTIARLDGDPVTLRFEPEDDEPWETEDVEQAIEAIRDDADSAEEFTIAVTETTLETAPAEDVLA